MTHNHHPAHNRIKERVALAVGGRADAMIWNVLAGQFRTIDGHRFVTGASPGFPDQMGIRTVRLFGRPFAQAVAFETKTGKGRLTEAQGKFRRRFEALGGLYVVVRDVADATREIERGMLMADVDRQLDEAAEGRPQFLDEAMAALSDDELVRLYEAALAEMQRRGIGVG